MDDPVSADGDLGVAGLAAGWIRGRSIRSVSPPADPQRGVVVDVLRAAADRRSAGRHPGAVDRHPGDADRILGDRAAGGRAADPVPGLGQLRDVPELDDLAVEYAADRYFS